MKQRSTHDQGHFHSLLTRKGQVTIPAAIRRRLNLRQGDQLSVVLDESEIRLAPTESRIDALYGSLASTVPALTAQQLRELAENAIAEEGALRNAPR